MPVSEPTGAIVTEAIEKLRDVLERQERSANRLGERIWWLNFWLLICTIVIGLLTTVQVYVAFQGTSASAARV